MGNSTEATFTELLQRPRDTVAKLEQTPRHGIRINRRDGEDLYLTTAARAEQVTEVVDSTTRIFVALMKSDPMAAKMLTNVFPEAFPWMRFLPQKAVQEFLVEFLDTARAASDLGTVSPLVPLIAAWKSTAEIYADPELREALLEPTEGDFGDVEAPQAADG
jgi:hypothetical protein